MLTPMRVFMIFLFRFRAAIAARFQSGVADDVAESSAATGSKDLRSDNDLRVLARVGVLAEESSNANGGTDTFIIVAFVGNGAVASVVAARMLLLVLFRIIRIFGRGGRSGFVDDFVDDFADDFAVTFGAAAAAAADAVGETVVVAATVSTTTAASK